MPAMLLTILLPAALVSADVQSGQGPARRVVAGSFSDADYPPEALRAQAQGTSAVDVEIDAGGRVTGCRVAQSAGNAALDTRTCRIFVERFRFASAPAASSRRLRIDWRLPAPPPPVAFAPAQTTVETVATIGGQVFCRVTSQGQPPAALLAFTCDPGASSGTPPRYWRTRRVDSFSLVADGRAPSNMPRAQGTVLQRYQLSFDVAADGSVSRCEPAGGLDEANAGAARQRCEALANDRGPAFTAAAGGDVRHGSIQALTFLQAR